MRPTRAESLMDTAEVWAQRSTCGRLHVGCVIHRDGRILVQGYNGAPSGLPHCPDRSDDIWEICHTWDDDPGMNINTECPVHPEHRGDWYMPRRQPWEGLVGAKGHTTAECRAVHAEQNAIAFAARWGVGLAGAEMSVTHQPCLSCAMSTINAGIVRVTYKEPYRLLDGVSLLEEAGIEVLKYPLLHPAPHDRIVK